MNRHQESSWCSRGPLIIVISGPSGVGKDALIARVKQLQPSFHFAVTATTRPPRSHEKQGEAYHFLTDPDFDQMLAREELLECAHVYGHRYGVPRDQMERPLAHGQDVLVKIDVQGAATVKRRFPQAILIFIAPASMEELSRHLSLRNTESRADFDLRLRTAENELKQLSSFDYAVVNREGELERAATEINAIITAETCRVAHTAA